LVVKEDSVARSRPFRPLLKAKHKHELRPAAWRRLGCRTPFTIPESKAEVTAAWLTTMLRWRGYLTSDEEVLEVKSKAIGEGEGEFSDLALVNLVKIRGDAPQLPRSLIAKFSPPDMAGLQLKIVFGSEAHFYNDLSVEGAGMVKPEAVYIGYEKRRCGTDKYCFIISNANPPSAPAILFKREDGCSSLPHLMLAMRALGRFHAQWWNCKQRGTLKWALHPHHAGGPLPRVPKGVTRLSWALVIKAGLTALPHCYKKDDAVVFGSEFTEFISLVSGKIDGLAKAVARELFRPPLTLVHGDAHLENIFFASHFEGGCHFIDFGLTMIGQPLQDVSFLIGTGIPVEVRRQCELQLVRHYHASLLEFGVTGYSFEQCWRDFQFQLFRSMVSLLTITPSFAKQRKERKGMFAPSPTEGDIKLYNMYLQLNKRLATALTDHKWHERLDELSWAACGCC